MSPCADDAVSVGQVLGTRGDINFDENGTLALTIGQYEAEVTFLYEKETSDYRFEQLYVTSEDDNPAVIVPIVKSQTTKKFVVDFGGVPISANSTLYWRVIVPDPLHACQGATAQPSYAIVRPGQRGLTAFPPAATEVQIVLPIAQPDDDWGFDQLDVEFNPALTKPDPVQVFSTPTVIERTVNGCKLVFSGAPTVTGYRILWEVR